MESTPTLSVTPLAEAEESVEEPEVQFQTFVLKLWVEEVDEETGQVTWRGHITHVASGERRYINEIRNIVEFTALYLERARAEPRMDGRMSQWLMKL